ncbi:MAG: hypothetical protein ABIJ56_13660 [Pseudomonadota bacterium]
MVKLPLAHVVTAVAALVLASCGAGPETAAPAQEPAPSVPEPDEAAPGEEMATHLEKIEEAMRDAAARLNEAVENEDPNLLSQAVNKKTIDLMIELKRKEAIFAGSGQEPGAAEVLGELNDKKVVFHLNDVKPQESAAELRAMAGSWLYLKSDVSLVVEDNIAKLDFSSWYAQGVANLDKGMAEREEKEAEMTAAAEKLVADLNKALDDGDAELLAGSLTQTTFDLAIEQLGLLPKKKGGTEKPTPEKLVKFLASKIDKEEATVNPPPSEAFDCLGDATDCDSASQCWTYLFP